MAQKRVKDWPEGERPRERLISHGPSSLSDAQLLAIILRTGDRDRGVMDLAISILDKFGSVSGMDAASVNDLKSVNGIGTAKICQIKAAFELGKRVMNCTNQTAPVFSSGEDVFRFFNPKFKGLMKEIFICCLLDAKNRLIKEYRVSEGTLTNSLIHPREAFREAVREAAKSVIFVHNHPSGDPTPSSEDIEVTKRLKSAGELVGINVLDHVVIGDSRFVSLQQMAML
ncbi:MAG: DNA repair protein RadC [Nitrospiraceae bacterium]|nr:DNA repair protein RadC [Nitrospiraceae bacterium]